MQTPLTVANTHCPEAIWVTSELIDKYWGLKRQATTILLDAPGDVPLVSANRTQVAVGSNSSES